MQCSTQYLLGALLSVILLLSGCNYQGAVAPLTVAGEKPGWRPPAHIVRPGDTLYSIAWQYGLNYPVLGAWNQIPPPYVIRVGEKIRLYPPASVPTPPRPTTPYQPVPIPKPQPVIQKPHQVAEKPQATKRPAPSRPDVALSAWLWPTKGTVISGFSSRHGGSKGIDISGQPGQPVVASNQGTVVYAGSGLRQYGNLVIIKHNDNYLSAYAHNRKLLVKEGDAVKRGDPIAAMGDTGTDRIKLHFEIRKQGKPVNPLNYLPAG